MGRFAYNALNWNRCHVNLEFNVSIQPPNFRPWDSVPCLNTAVGAKVKLLKPAEVREWS